MGNKRPHADAEPSGQHYENPDRKRLRTGNTTNNRPHRPKPAVVDLDSINAIKKRARAIERLLARDNLKLPSHKQRDLERELAAHKQRIEDARSKKDRSKMIQKYHMVRFFGMPPPRTGLHANTANAPTERKKAMRFAKQLEKKVAQATDPEEVSQLKADLHVAQVDIDYAIYFPFMEPYISLYAGAASKEKDETSTAAHYLRTPRPPMWTVVEKTREEGQSALEKLQNRQPQSTSDTEAAQQPAEHDVPAKNLSSAQNGKKRGARQEAKLSKSRSSRLEKPEAKAKEEEDESDDGGFFE
jgi:hypothetical protein